MFKQIGPNHNPTFKVQVQISNSKKFLDMENQKKLHNKMQR